MCASWNDKFKVDLIADKFEQIKTIHNDGKKISFNAFDYHDYFAVLCTIAILSKDIPEIEKHRILNESISSAGKKGVITSKILLKEISK
jgi:hypothetical protein